MYGELDRLKDKHTQSYSYMGYEKLVFQNGKGVKECEDQEIKKLTSTGQRWGRSQYSIHLYKSGL